MSGFPDEAAAKTFAIKKSGFTKAKILAVWRGLLRDNTVGCAVAGDYTHAEFLASVRSRVKEGVDVGRADRRRGRPKQPRPGVDLTPAELLRSWAFSTYVGRFAGTDSAVVEFRKRHLNGTVLEADAAQKFIESVAITHPHPLRDDVFVRQSLGRVPTLEPGQSVILYKARFPVGPGLPIFLESFRERLDEAFHPSLVIWVKHPPDQPIVLLIRVSPRSELDQLRILTRRLMGKYPWEEHDAAWFALTGAAPFISPITVRTSWRPLVAQRDPPEAGSKRISGYTHVSLDVAPWLSAETVKINFRSIQKKLLIRDKRIQQDRTLRLVILVNELLSARGEDMTWERITQEWNRRHPRLRYLDYRTVRNTYLRAVKSITQQAGPEITR